MTSMELDFLGWKPDTAPELGPEPMLVTPMVVTLLENKRSMPNRSLLRGVPEDTRASEMFAEQRKTPQL